MIELFLTLAVTYTSLEISYWYFRWWRSIRKDNLPIVRSLLLAIFIAQLVIFGGYVQHLLLNPPFFEDALWLISVLIARTLYMIPVWKQGLPSATIGMYLLRMGIFATVITLIGTYV